MPDLKAVMASLKAKGAEKTRKIYARHGMEADRLIGVSVADLKTIAKTVKGEQELAYQLYATGMMEAMYLAGMVADGAKMTRALLEEWAEGAAGLQMISEYTVPWVAVEHAEGQALAKAWIASKKEPVSASGWCTYTGLVMTKADEDLDVAEIEKLLEGIPKAMQKAPNRVRYTMNGFVIAVGGYVKPLLKRAKATARAIGVVKVEMGETACTVPLATASLEKIEALGRVGQKRKTIRC
jgi:3-methyladenine DNA glycosylase AlkD